MKSSKYISFIFFLGVTSIFAIKDQLDPIEVIEPTCLPYPCDSELCEPVFVTINGTDGIERCYDFPNSCIYENMLCPGIKIPKKYERDCNDRCRFGWTVRCNYYVYDPVYINVVNENGIEQCRMFPNSCFYSEAKCGRDLRCKTHQIVKKCQQNCCLKDCKAKQADPVQVKMPSGNKGGERCFVFTSIYHYENMQCSGIIPTEYEYNCPDQPYLS